MEELETPGYFAPQNDDTENKNTRRNFVLLPIWSPVRIWESVVAVVAMISSTLVIFQASYDGTSSWVTGLLYFCDLIFVLGIVSRFLTGYEKKGVVVTTLKEIFLHNLNTTFIVDVISIIPFELIALGTSHSDYYAAFLRLNRVLRCYKLWYLCILREEELGSQSGIIKVARFTYLAALSIHIQACVWFALACNNVSYGSTVECSRGSWANDSTEIPLDINLALSSAFDKYIVSLYWAVATMTTTGYGDIHPLREGEKWFAIFSMLWGVVMFGYILGGLASMLTNQDSQRARYVHRLEAIKDHLKEAQVSDTLTNKVIGYYQYIWMRNKGQDGTEAFEELPDAFQAELSFETYQKMILQSDLFKKTPQGFVRMLSTSVKHMLYLPNQVIVNKGDIGHEMYFIHKGRVEVLSGDQEDDPEVIASFKEGEMFGEINLVYSIASQTWIRACTHCDLLIINKNDVLKSLQHFPNVAEDMKSVINMRYTKAAKSIDDNTRITESTNEQQQYDTVSHSSNSHSPFKRPLHWLLHEVILPQSQLAIVWNSLLMIVILITSWLYSFQASFSHFNPSLGYSEVSLGELRFSATYILDIFLLMDIFVTFKKAIQTENGFQTNHKVIAKSYITSIGFILDVLAILPLEVFAFTMPDHGLDWAITLKINRLIKLWKFMALFSKMESSLNYDIGKIRSIKFFFYIVILTHILGCIWFPLACYTEGECRTLSWATEHNISSNTSSVHNYIISLYWAAATTTSTGYGDVTAVNTSERIVALIAMVIGLILYGYILGAIAATIANGLSPKVTFQEKMNAVHQFMSDNSLGKGLSERVDQFYSLLWSQTKGEALPGEEYLFKHLPKSLQEDVGMEEFLPLLSNVKFLRNTDTAFLRQLSLYTHTYLFAPGDMIVYYGDTGTEMYCIRKGYVEVLTEDMSEIVTTAGPGGYFGELGFLFGSPRTASVRAGTHCELIMFSREDLNCVIESFPLIAKEFQEISECKDHLNISRKAALEASRRAMLRPHSFATPCVLSGLATALSTSLAAITRTPLATAIASTVGSKDFQSKLSCPNSLAPPELGVIVKYDRKLDNEKNKIKSSEESGMRLRAKVHDWNDSIEDFEVVEFSPSSANAPVPWYKLVLNVLGKFLSCFILPYIFIPQSLPGVTREVISSILGLVSVITISLQASFVYSFEPFSIPLWIINYGLDLFFLCDVILKVHSAYYSSDGVLITKPSKCAKHYIKTNLLFDVIASFPTELLLPFIALDSSYNISRMLSLVRLNRVIRVYNLPLLFGYLEEQITRSTGLITEIKFAAYLTMGTHLTACIWFLLACSSISYNPRTCDVNSWVLKGKFVGNSLTTYNIGYQYIVSLYWAFTTTITVGYGDIHAHTDSERFFGLLVMIVGIVSYGYIIATVAASLANADSGRARYQEKLKAIQKYLQDQSMDVTIQHRVINYYEYIWQRTKGMSFGSLFKGMPISLQADISLSLYKKIIDQVPLFQNTEIGFTKLLALHIKPVLYLSKEYIVRKGDIGSEMFFINRGTVEVVSEDGEVVFATMNEGKFFGEISLIFSCPRTASIRAATNCDLFVLTKESLDASLTNYPHIGEQIREVAGNRANLVKKRSQAAAKAAAEGKSASDAAKAAAEVTKDAEEDGSKRRRRGSSIASALKFKMFGGSDSIDEEPEPSCCSDCMHSCYDSLKSVVWPKLQPFVVFTISPVGKFGTIYSYVGCLMAFFSFFTITYQAFFQSESVLLWVINYIVETYFLFEIFVKFHLGYLNSQGQLVADFKSSALHYLKKPLGFPLDLIAILPVELIPLPIPNKHTRTAALLYLRIIHSIRVIRIKDFFAFEEKRLNQKTVLIKMLKFIVLISLSTHFVACIWYVLGCNCGNCLSNTWAEVAGFVDGNAPQSLHYCDSLYWAVATLTSTGYGDYSATNTQEIIYATLVMVVGKLMFGFILGSIASTLANLEMQRVMFEEKLSSIKEYMNEQQLSGKLRSRVLRFFDYLWVRNKGVNRRSLFDDMPSCMLAEVSLATTERLLKEVPIFASVGPSFLRHLTLKIKSCLYLPNEYIVHKEDVGYGIFFIYRGTVEIVKENVEKSKVITTGLLHAGSYFGQENMIYNVPWDASYRAKSHCDIFTLSPGDFKEVLKCHPAIETQIAETVNEMFGVPMSNN